VIFKRRISTRPAALSRPRPHTHTHTRHSSQTRPRPWSTWRPTVTVTASRTKYLYFPFYNNNNAIIIIIIIIDRQFLTRRNTTKTLQGCASLSANSHTYYYLVPPYPITHSLFHSRLKHPFSANPSHCSPSFLFLNIHYVDSSDCLLLFLSISVFYL